MQYCQYLEEGPAFPPDFQGEHMRFDQSGAPDCMLYLIEHEKGLDKATERASLRK